VPEKGQAAVEGEKKEEKITKRLSMIREKKGKEARRALFAGVNGGHTNRKMAPVEEREKKKEGACILRY